MKGAMKMETNKEFIFTQEGYENLEKQLEELKTTVRYEIAERIKVALGFGDLSENSEYDEAKNAQAANEMKIAELEEKIKYARIIDESEIDTEVVQVGNIVKVLDMEYDELIGSSCSYSLSETEDGRCYPAVFTAVVRYMKDGVRYTRTAYVEMEFYKK